MTFRTDLGVASPQKTFRSFEALKVPKMAIAKATGTDQPIALRGFSLVFLCISLCSASTLGGNGGTFHGYSDFSLRQRRVFQGFAYLKCVAHKSLHVLSLTSRNKKADYRLKCPCFVVLSPGLVFKCFFREMPKGFH